MAEFAEVCKQWRRMCAMLHEQHGACGEDCPMGNNDVCGFTHTATDADIEQAEHIIMDWAKANPEPVYPTWVEWLVECGVLTPTMDTDLLFFEGEKHHVMAVRFTPKAYGPIPADIAEKLGIKPKEE